MRSSSPLARRDHTAASWSPDLNAPDRLGTGSPPPAPLPTRGRPRSKATSRQSRPSPGELAAGPRTSGRLQGEVGAARRAARPPPDELAAEPRCSDWPRCGLDLARPAVSTLTTRARRRPVVVSPPATRARRRIAMLSRPATRAPHRQLDGRDHRFPSSPPLRGGLVALGPSSPPPGGALVDLGPSSPPLRGGPDHRQTVSSFPFGQITYLIAGVNLTHRDSDHEPRTQRQQ